MSHIKMILIAGIPAFVIGISIPANRLLGQPTASPATSPSGDDKDNHSSKQDPPPKGVDPAEAEWTAEDYRVRADALWSVKHDYAKALETYRKGLDRFPKCVRILVSLAATSIDFGSQNKDTDPGRAAYKEAKAAIDKGLGLIADGTGKDVDRTAKVALTRMSYLIPD